MGPDARLPDIPRQLANMPTDRSTAAWPPRSSMYLLACLLALKAFSPTDAMPIYTNDDVWEETKTNSSTLGIRGHHFLDKPSGRITISRIARAHEHPKKHKATGAIVGGTIGVGIVLGLTVFVCFKIYKEYVIYRRHENQANDASTNSRHNKGPRTTLLGRMGASFRHAWSPAADDSVSIASFGNLSTAAQVGTTAPTPGPAIPPKAADLLGIRQNAWNLQVPATPPPLTATAPASPPPLPLHQQPLRPLPLRSPWSRRSSASTMSTLGRELLEDTRHTPSPHKYSTSPRLPGGPSRPPRTPPPLPPPAPPSSTDETLVDRGSSPRYFVPTFSPWGRLQTTSSPAETLWMETMRRERWEGKRFSMGSNVI